MPLRELHEEAGIGDGVVIRELGRPSWPSKYENHAFEVRSASHEATDTWEHVVQGDGDDAGLVFLFRWEPCAQRPELFNRTDPLLEKL